MVFELEKPWSTLEPEWTMIVTDTLFQRPKRSEKSQVDSHSKNTTQVTMALFKVRSPKPIDSRMSHQVSYTVRRRSSDFPQYRPATQSRAEEHRDIFLEYKMTRPTLRSWTIRVAALSSSIRNSSTRPKIMICTYGPLPMLLHTYCGYQTTMYSVVGAVKLRLAR